jgi:hypothetical protein
MIAQSARVELWRLLSKKNEWGSPRRLDYYHSAWVASWPPPSYQAASAITYQDQYGFKGLR